MAMARAAAAAAGAARAAAPRPLANGGPDITMGPIPVPRPPIFPFPFAPYPDGTLLKSQQGAEIDMMQGHERRWIPDPQTFNYMGMNWNSVQSIPDAVWHSIPSGPAFPSRSDGTLLKGSGPEIYVMQNGQRHWIPDPTTFNAMGYSWSAVQAVADSDLAAIPLGAQIPEAGTLHPVFPIIASQDDNFPGSGGFMHTDATVFSTGLLNAVTHTWEVTDLRGFKGAVAVVLLDQNQNKLWVSATQHFGVDGRWIGTSDRTDNWSDNVPATILSSARYIAIVQQWDPNIVQDIENWINGLSNIAQTLGPLIKTIATIFG